MKIAFLSLMAGLVLLTAEAGAQVKVRPIDNGGSSTGVNVLPPKQPQKTLVTVNHIALSPDREWTSRDGRSMTARLIAHEIAAMTKGGTVPASAIVVMKEGKVRLLREKKVHLLSIDQLSEKDQAFVKDKVDRIRRAAAAEKKPAAPAEK